MPTTRNPISRIAVAIAFAVVVPAGTPRLVIERLHAESVRAVRVPELVTRLQDLGATPVGTSPEQFAVFIRAEMAKWGPVVKSSGAKVD